MSSHAYDAPAVYTITVQMHTNYMYVFLYTIFAKVKYRDQLHVKKVDR